MAEHINTQFDVELEAIRSQVLGMAGLVEDQVREAMRALASGDPLVIQKVLDRETEVNDMHVKLDDMCVHMIARRQPAASDLRMVMTVIKSVEDLERTGDKAARICQRARTIFESGRLQVPRFSELSHIADLALAMLASSLDAFARRDAVKAASVVRDDSRLDEEYRALQRQLITVMMEDPRTITLTLETQSIAKAIERIGDYAVSIAKYTIYLVKGEDVRHRSLEAVELAAGTPRSE